MSGNNEALKVNACLVFLSTLLRIAERLAAEQLLLIPQDFSVTLKLTSSDLSNLASEYLNNYNKLLKEKEDWESKHPDEQWSNTGTYLSPIVSGVSTVDNINNIYEYLSIPKNDLPQGNTNPYILGGILAVSCLVVFLAVIFIFKKEKKRKAY